MESKILESFITKFSRLTPENQKYIITIEQALVFAQTQGVDITKQKDFFTNIVWFDKKDLE